jgi:hypothetical protein
MAIKNKEGYHKMPNGKIMKDSSMKYGIKETPKMEKKEDAMKMKMSKVMKEYKAGELNMGKSKKMVKSPKQAIAIGLSISGLGKTQMSSPKKMSKSKAMPKMKVSSYKMMKK